MPSIEKGGKSFSQCRRKILVDQDLQAARSSSSYRTASFTAEGSISKSLATFAIDPSASTASASVAVGTPEAAAIVDQMIAEVDDDAGLALVWPPTHDKVVFQIKITEGPFDDVLEDILLLTEVQKLGVARCLKAFQKDRFPIGSKPTRREWPI